MNSGSISSVKKAPQKRGMSAVLRRLAARRMAGPLAIGGLLTLSAHSASAQTFAYSGQASGSVATPATGNFTLGFNGDGTAGYVTPTGGAATVLSFGGPAGATDSYVATNDITGLSVGKLLFTNSGTTGIAGNSLDVSGTGASIANNGTGLVTITAPLTTTAAGTAAAPDLVFNGTGTVAFTEAAAGAETATSFIGITNGSTVQVTNNINPFGTATLVLNNGNLALTSTSATLLSPGNPIVVTGGTTDTISSASSNNNFGGAITGSGRLNLAITGTNLVTFNSSFDSFTGTMALAPVSGVESAGTIRFNSGGGNTSFGSTGTVFDLGQGTGKLTQRNGTTINLGSLLGGTNTSLVGGTAASTYSIGAARTNPMAVDTFNGKINNGTGAGTTSITKVGAGSFVLTNGTGTSTGTTTITAGNLVIANTSGSATGTGAVNESGAGGAATLSGTGISTGLLTVTNANHVSPGVNTPGSNFGTAGTLTVGASALTAATLDYDLGATAAGANDLLTAGGALSLGAMTFNFNELGGSLQTGTAYTLISGATSVDTSAFAPTTGTFTGGANFNVTYTPTTTGLTVQFSAAPEPGETATMSLIGLGLAGLFLRARKRHKAEAA